LQRGAAQDRFRARREAGQEPEDKTVVDFIEEVEE